MSRRKTLTMGWTLFCLLPLASVAAAESRLLGPAGKCLGVAGTPAERDPVVLATCAGSDRNAHQRWEIPALGFSGEVKLGGLCLDVDQASSEDRTPIQLFRCHGGANQQWQLESRGRLVGLAGKCLDIENGSTTDGSRAVLFACQGGDNQIFLAEPYEAWSASYLPVAVGYNQIVPTSDPRVAYQYDTARIRRTTDGGRTWATVDEPDQDFGLGLAVDPRQPNTVWRIDEYRRIFRSDDGARTWRLVAEQMQPGGERLYLVQASSFDPNVVVAVGESGFFLSRDHGQHFERQGDLPLPSPNNSRNFGELVETSAGSWLLAHFGNCGSGGAGCDGDLWLTTDFASTWTKVADMTGSYSSHLARPADSAVIYNLEDDGDLLRSDDDGATFSLKSRLPRDSNLPSFASLAVDPGQANRLFATFASKLWGSVDGGVSWTLVAASQIQDVGRRADTVAALGGNTWTVLTSDGNIYTSDHLQALVSRDGGATWVQETNGLPGGSTALVAGAQPGLFYGRGSEGHSAIWRTQNHGRTWEAIVDSPCLDRFAADPVESDLIYWSRSAYCPDAPDSPLLTLSRDAGETRHAIPPPGVGAIRFLAVVRQPGGSAIVVGDDGFTLSRSVDQGATWQAVVVAPNQAIYRVIADGSVLYVTTFARVYRSIDGGATWTLFLDGVNAFEAGGGKYSFWSGAETSTVSSAAGSFTVDRLVTSIDSHGHLYDQDERSTDNGLTWQSLEPGLLSTYATVLADPFDRERLMAMTNSGPMVGRFTGRPDLVLGNGRFRVSLNWHAPDGARGIGKAEKLAADTGAFWFFNPERSEVAVKILDGRAINGRFWVFVGSLTNVEFDVEVLDLVSGEKRRYHNPNNHFASFGDTLALPLGAPQASIPSIDPTHAFPVGQPQVSLASRFSLSIQVSDPNTGAVYAGLGRQISGDTAAFTFFSPNNIELLVNVIDGRPLNGHFWIFGASLTNVSYVLEVRDNVTGDVKTYENPAGTFASFGDTSAFRVP